MFRPDPLFDLSIPAFRREALWLREEIAGLEEELAYSQKRIAAIEEKEMPELVAELIRRRCELDEFATAIAVKKAKLGGAQ